MYFNVLIVKDGCRKNGYIKLPYGFVSNENDKQKLRFNLPLDYKK